MYQKIRLFLTAVLLTLVFIVPVSANSAIKSWHGSSGNGAYIMDEDCPVICEREDLLFEIGSFPDAFEELQAYDASVTAVYTLHNPTDSAIDVRLVFPFGEDPQYLYYRNPAFDERLEDYEILRNGLPLEKKIRYSLKTGDDFEVKADLERLRDEYQEDAFYRIDLPVFEYVYEVTGMEKEGDAYPEWQVELDIDRSAQRLIIGDEDLRSFQSDAEGHVSAAYTPTENGALYRIFLLGDDLIKEAVWSGLNTQENASGEVRLIEKNQIAFAELVLSEKPDERISDIDWYNACVDYLKDRSILTHEGDPFTEMNYSLLRWYEYELSFAPGETLSNSVKAPIYPDIDGYYEPPVYTYRYLLSPASTWADFSDLNITVSTSYPMIDNKDFSEEEGKYTLYYDRLPEGELSFSLSQNASPKHSGDGIFYIVIGILVVAAVLFLLLLGAVIRLFRKLLHK